MRHRWTKYSTDEKSYTFGVVFDLLTFNVGIEVRPFTGAYGWIDIYINLGPLSLFFNKEFNS